VRRRLNAWQSAGLLQPHVSEPDTWHLCVGTPSMDQLRAQMETGESDSDDDDQPTNVDESDKLESLNQYWNYISGLIKSLDALKPERVHSLMRMLRPGQPQPTLDHVIAFLQHKVKQNVLTYSGGVYRMAKK